MGENGQSINVFMRICAVDLAEHSTELCPSEKRSCCKRVDDKRKKGHKVRTVRKGRLPYTMEHSRNYGRTPVE